MLQDFGFPSPRNRVKYKSDMFVKEGGLDGRSIPFPKIDLYINYEPPTRPRTLSKVASGGRVGLVAVVKRHFRVL